MRKTLPTLSIFFSVLIALSSCKATRESKAQRKADIEQSKEATTACFIIMNDGTVKNYASLKLKTGLMKTPYLLADKKIKIMARDIKAYQNKDHYAISQSNFTSGRKSYVATETLPGFAVRIAKGKINVYSKKYFNGAVSVDEYFVQKADDGQVLSYTAENMNKLVKNDDEALAFFVEKKYNTTKSKKEIVPAGSSVDDPSTYAKTGKIVTTSGKVVTKTGKVVSKNK